MLGLILMAAMYVTEPIPTPETIAAQCIAAESTTHMDAGDCYDAEAAQAAEDCRDAGATWNDALGCED